MENNKTLSKEQEVEIKVFNLNCKYLPNNKVLIKLDQEIDHCKIIKNRSLKLTFYLHLI